MGLPHSFLYTGVRTTAKISEEVILMPVLKPLNDTLIIQKNSVLGHKSKCCQEWLVNHVSAFI